MVAISTCPFFLNRPFFTFPGSKEIKGYFFRQAQTACWHVCPFATYAEASRNPISCSAITADPPSRNLHLRTFHLSRRKACRRLSPRASRSARKNLDPEDYWYHCCDHHRSSHCPFCGTTRGFTGLEPSLRGWIIGWNRGICSGNNSPVPGPVFLL